MYPVIIMKLLRNIPLIIIAGFISLLIYSSCANQGMPTGGPKDSLPPVLIRSVPRFGALNFKGKEIRLTFNEYIAIDKVMDQLVVSPPLQKRPTLLMKSKTLILQFNEDLRDSVTYSVDFKNSIEDNNERNPYENLRISFSTGESFDSLRVAGMVKNAENLNPIENGLVVLQKNRNDSAIYKHIPDYIGKTNEKGIFFIDNIAPGSYHIFSINDVNGDMKYNEGVEEIAFSDSIVVPEAKYYEELDTIVRGADSLLVSGHVHFLPEPIYLLRFTEDLNNQFLTTVMRESKYKCLFIFEEPVADTFGLNLLDSDVKDWYMLEPNPSMDSITLWVRDTTIAKRDTINLEVLYNQIDSIGQIYLKKDTFSLVYSEEEKDIGRRKRKEKEGESVAVPQFTISDNLVSTGFDLNSSIYLTTPEPVKYLNYDQVHLYVDEDKSDTPLVFSIGKDTTAWRRYKLDYKWEPNTEYRLEIDSTASENIFGITNQRLVNKFKTQKSDFYGKIILETKNVEGSVIIQLLKGDEKNEQLLKSKIIETEGKLVFDYLAPGKYIIKAIYDSNKNGKWDTGSFREHRQPEKVAYYPLVIKVRSNWEQKQSWDLTINPEYPKKLFDPDAEAEAKKAIEEEKIAKPNQSNNNRSLGGSSGILGRP